MSLYRQRQALKAQIIDAQGLLDVVGDHPLMSVGLIERIKAYSEELESLPEVSSDPTVELLFSGDAVSGSQGIKANFISKAVPSFQELVKAKVSKERSGRARRGEKVKREESSDLFLTALPRGSFGVELSQLKPNEAFDGAVVSKAIKDVIKLVANATSDENFEASLKDTTKTELVSLRKFLRGITEENSILTMESGEVHLELSKEKVADAYQRVSSTIREESEVIFDGIFRGILLDSRRFEFQLLDGTRISGKISEDINDWDMVEYKTFLGTHCKFYLRTYETTFKTGNEKKEYELLNIEQNR